MSYWPLILVVDNSSKDIQTIAEVLNSEYRIKVARNGLDALAFASGTPVPDLILLEAHMPDMDGFEVCRRLKQTDSTRDIPIIFVTSVQDEAKEALAMDLHAADYITKPYSIAVARARIRNKILSHRLTSSKGAAPAVSGIVLTQPAGGSREPDKGLGLGKRQIEVLTLVVEGLTSAEIAEQLSIAKGTVEVHRENIMRKLGVRNIAGLVKCAIRHGLMSP